MIMFPTITLPSSTTSCSTVNLIVHLHLFEYEAFFISAPSFGATGYPLQEQTKRVPIEILAIIFPFSVFLFSCLDFFLIETPLLRKASLQA